MPRRGRSTTIGKIARIHHDRRVSEIRVLGERLRDQQRAWRNPDARQVDSQPEFLAV
jgi:hypothetical protein